tara:strand:- start:129 stop:557 length:429 start_codon:yes stop_codon:yes gene_type:complete
MVIGIIHNTFFKYPFALLVFPVVLLSSPGVEIQVNQPGTLILSVHLDSVWIDEYGTIQTSPKGIVLPDNISVPFQSQEHSRLATLNGIPNIKRRPSAVLKIFPISVDEENISWFADVTIQLTWNPEDPSFTPVLLTIGENSI